MSSRVLATAVLLALAFAGQGEADVRAPGGRTLAPAVAGPRAWLGCTAVALEPEQGVGNDAVGGATITAVVPGGPAAIAGIARGDVIVAIDGEPVGHPIQLARALATRQPGASVRLLVLSNERVEPVAVTLGAPPVGPAPRIEARRIVGRVLARAEGGDVARALALQFAGDHERAHLGIETLDLTPGLAAYFGAPEGRGLLIRRVAEGSPAARAGLRAGDVLLTVGGRAIETRTELEDVLRSRHPGERLRLSVLRDGMAVSVESVLGRHPVPVWVFGPGPEPLGQRRAPSVIDARPTGSSPNE